MSLNIVSRLALAFGALTLATLPAFAETSATAAPAAVTSTAPTAATAKPAVKHHVKKATLHHKKAVKKDAVEKTGVTTTTPAAPADAAASTPKL